MNPNDRMPNKSFPQDAGYRILAKDIYVSNDTRKTMLNNNDLIIGPSGCGKTGGYVIPNIRSNSGSIVIADTKGQLHKMLRSELESAGYTVKVLDFVNLSKSCSYNPMDYVSHGSTFGSYREQDVYTISNAIMPMMDKDEPFWENSAKTLIACFIAFAIEALPRPEQNLCSVLKMARLAIDRRSNTETPCDRMFEELSIDNPNSFAVKLYHSLKSSFDAEKMWASIMQFVVEALKMFDFSEARQMFLSKDRFRIQDLGRKKMVLFVNVSDTDRAFDNLINVFYTQLFQVLCAEADKNEDGRLRVPVRVILDDFATNVHIPYFENIISVIRSRDISVSLILQSITQLEVMYSKAKSLTIINNCDHLLYLGGLDVETARFISMKANRSTDTILNMRLNDAFLFERGTKPRMVEKVKPYSRVEMPGPNPQAPVEPPLEWENRPHC